MNRSMVRRCVNSPVILDDSLESILLTVMGGFVSKRADSVATKLFHRDIPDCIDAISHKIKETCIVSKRNLEMKSVCVDLATVAIAAVTSSSEALAPVNAVVRGGSSHPHSAFSKLSSVDVSSNVGVGTRICL